MNAAADSPPALQAIPLEQISLGKNYRHRRPANWEAKLAELGESMKQSGQLEPALVRPHSLEGERNRFEIVFGERRYRAAKKAGLETLLCLVRDIPDELVLETQVEENNQREDPHPLDEAEGFAELVKRGRTPAEIAAKLGRDVGYVQKRLTLCQLVPAATRALDEEKITFGVALLLARIPDKKLQAEALGEVSNRSWEGLMRVDEARQLIEDEFMLRLESAPFDTADAALVMKAGPCTTCPKRTGAQAELFADIKSKDLCTDRSCYKDKVEALWQIRKKEAEAGGTEVLEGKEAASAVHGNKYRDLNEEIWVGQKRKKVRDLLGKKDLPPITLARVEQHGDVEIVQLVPKADVDKVLKTKLKSKEDREDALDDGAARSRASQKAQERKVRLRRQAIQESLGQAVERVGKVPDAKLIDLLVRTLAARAWSEVQASVLERRGGKPKAGSYETALLKLVNDGKPEDVAGIGLELALRASAPWHAYANSSGGRSEGWRSGLKLVGVDFDAIERRIVAEDKERQKAKGRKKAKAAPAAQPRAKKAAKKKAKAR
jgi:ParB/RepB/Spo0J family partition protein